MHLKHKILFFYLLAILLYSPSTLFAQHQADNWYFGHNAGLSFATNPPTILTNGALNTLEGCSTISDTAGNLLFYTDGITVYNKVHQIMQNGTGLLGHSSSTQSGIIVPQPGNDSIFYIFTVAKETDSAGLQYSVVNINHNAGLGEVVIKNTPLLTPTCEKVTAAMHCNNKDIWVVTRKFASDQFYSWLVTTNGISNTPVISATGNVIGTWPPLNSITKSLGQLKISPNGKKMLSVNWSNEFSELGDFNNATGRINNIIKMPSKSNLSFLPGSTSRVYGAEFSPDSKLIYISSSIENGVTWGFHDFYFLSQYNISNWDSTQIINSHYIIDSTALPGMIFCANQLAPNNKIYIANVYNGDLHVINTPDSIGAACNYQRRIIVFPAFSGSYGIEGLPNFIQSYFDPNSQGYNFTTTNNCSTLSALFTIANTNNIDSVKWNFGDNTTGINNFSTSINPIHNFSTNGNYTIQLLVYPQNSCNRIDTITKNSWIGTLSVNLGNDTTICTGDTLSLNVNIPNATNLWSNGTNGTSIKVKQPGTYWVTTTLQTCVVTDTIHVLTRPLPTFSLGNDTTLCNTNNFTLQPTPSFIGANYTWSNNAITPTTNINSTGLHWLQLTDIFGCKNRDTINVNFVTIPTINLGNDTTICKNDSITLTANIPSTTNLWSDGSIGTTIKVTQPNTYWIRVTKQGCINTDTIKIFNYSLLQFSLGNDTAICNNATINVTPTPNYASAQYLWSTNAVTPNITATTANNYWLQITDNNTCKFRDTINISYKTLPNFNLGNDTSICANATITLNANVTGATNFWNNGSVGTTLTVNQPGIYWCDVNKAGCIYRDSILLTIKPLPIVQLGADTTLCEGATMNLNATNTSATYLWQDGTTNNTYLVSNAGLYNVVVSKAGCISTDTINISYTLKPVFTLGSDKLICQGQSIIIQPIINPFWQLLWQDGTTSSTYTVTQPGTYSLQATNNCGFLKDDVIFTTGGCNVYVPGAFAPNGTNKIFKVLGVELITAFHLQIFNRYGQLVYETTDKNKGWDGTINNQPSTQGAYVYKLNYKDSKTNTAQLINGSFILIR